MNTLKIKATFLLTSFLFVQCKKETVTESEKLPPATQKGANTFGCLINNTAWIPKGYEGRGTPNPKISFDYYNGNQILSIETAQFEKNCNPLGYFQLSFLAPNLSTGVYSCPDNLRFSMGWPEVLNNCFIDYSETTQKRCGVATISKFGTDRIISGTFSCKFKSPGCDTIYITQGRFDLKF
ncbi:MAG: hypothetical protein NVS3B19_19610 [Ginsengibacter sp.]